MTKMERQQWLAKFLELVDGDAPAIAYRKYLGITFANLHAHVRKIGEYRKELEELNEAKRREGLKKLINKPEKKVDGSSKETN